MCCFILIIIFLVVGWGGGLKTFLYSSVGPYKGCNSVKFEQLIPQTRCRRFPFRFNFRQRGWNWTNLDIQMVIWPSSHYDLNCHTDTRYSSHRVPKHCRKMALQHDPEAILHGWIQMSSLSIWQGTGIYLNVRTVTNYQLLVPIPRLFMLRFRLVEITFHNLT